MIQQFLDNFFNKMFSSFNKFNSIPVFCFSFIKISYFCVIFNNSSLISSFHFISKFNFVLMGFSILKTSANLNTPVLLTFYHVGSI